MNLHSVRLPVLSLTLPPLQVFMLTLFVMLFLDKWDFVVYIAYPVAAVAGVGVGAVYLLPW